MGQQLARRQIFKDRGGLFSLRGKASERWELRVDRKIWCGDRCTSNGIAGRSSASNILYPASHPIPYQPSAHSAKRYHAVIVQMIGGRMALGRLLGKWRARSIRAYCQVKVSRIDWSEWEEGGLWFGEGVGELAHGYSIIKYYKTIALLPGSINTHPLIDIVAIKPKEG